MTSLTCAPASALAVAAAVLRACWASVALAQLPGQPSREPPGPPPGGRVDTVRVTVGPAGVAPVGSEPITRLRGDTLWWIVPGGVFPRDTLDPRGLGTTDTLVVLFGRDSTRDGAGRDVAWRLIGRARRPLPPALLPVLREVRALAAENP